MKIELTRRELKALHATMHTGCSGHSYTKARLTAQGWMELHKKLVDAMRAIDAKAK